MKTQFVVEVTETFVTRYEIQAADAEEAEDIATMLNVEGDPGVRQSCERQVNVIEPAVSEVGEG